MLYRLLRLWYTLGPILQPLVLDILESIRTSPNPKQAALRALQRTAEVTAFDQAMKKAKG